MNFKHYVFTNLGVGITDIEWLYYRTQIFFRTSYQSLLNQSETDFHWVIFVDNRLPVAMKWELSRKLRDCKCNTKIIELESYSDIIQKIKNLILKDNSKYIITTRIDDDDLIHKDGIYWIQSNFDNNMVGCKLISFKNGLEYLPVDSIARNIKYDTLALGLTLISERNENTRVINEFAHHIIRDTLTKQGVKFASKTIEHEEPTFIYTKHPLSDSSFVGARARILKDSNKFSIYNLNVKNIFGVSIENFRELQKILSESPIGMPYKYLEVLGNLRLDLSKVADKNERAAIKAKIFSKENFCTRKNPSIASVRNRKIRLAIFGSCVTIDLFQAVPSLLDKIDIVYYNTRANIISAMSLPNTDSHIVINKKNFENVRSQRDLEKSYWKGLKESQPDVVIVDLIDERIGTIEYMGSNFTASGPILNAFEKAKRIYEIKRPWNYEIVERRNKLIPIFFERLQSICSNILVHKCEWSSHYIHNDTIHSIEKTKFNSLRELNNKILLKCYNIILEENIPVDFLGGNKDFMLCGGEHFWEFSPINYDKKYYQALASELTYKLLM